MTGSLRLRYQNLEVSPKPKCYSPSFRMMDVYTFPFVSFPSFATALSQSDGS